MLNELNPKNEGSVKDSLFIRTRGARRDESALKAFEYIRAIAKLSREVVNIT